ncbi:WecB/TagA/CpsF family glycosyltransferase [Candidatus Gracilibacteria bacterium]|nr:WecB/TagA/CpsF family glycosyltransferase [Candidatus Gracilibacteria bacterium]
MQIFGVPLHRLEPDTFFTEITAFQGQKKVFTPNPEMLLKAKDDTEFHDILRAAEYLTIDGIGLYFGFQALEYKSRFIRFLLTDWFFFNILFRRKYLEKKYGKRICGSDLTRELIKYASKNNIRVAIIDPYFPHDLKKVEAQKTFREDLSGKYPDLKFDYYIYKDPQQVGEQIKGSEAKILFSTLGMKSQEQSVIDIMQVCPNIKLGLGIGSSFDGLTGFQKRCPDIVSKIGAEWLYRIITTPRKLRQFQKIWRAVFVFSWEIIMWKG